MRSRYDGLGYVASLLKADRDKWIRHVLAWSIVFGIPFAVTWLSATVFRALDQGDASLAGASITGVFVLALLRAGLVVLADIAEFELSYAIAMRVRETILHEAIHKGTGAATIGDWISRIRDEAGIFGQLACALSSVPIRVALTMAAAASMVVVGSMASLPVILAIACGTILVDRLAVGLASRRRDLVMASSRVSTLVHESIAHAEVLRSFSAIHPAAQRLASSNIERARAAIIESTWATGMSGVIPTAIHVSIAVMICLVALGFSGRLEVSAFVAFTGYAMILAESCAKIGRIHILAGQARVAYERLVSLCPDAFGSRGSTAGAGARTQRDEGPSLSRRQLEAFLDGSMTRKSVAIRDGTARPGAIRLFRLWAELVALAQQRDPTSPRTVLFVDEQPTLVSGTLKDNIVLGQEVSEVDLWAALEIVDFRTDLERLPDGLQTIVGTRGLGLSGGQVQRVVIARALLRKPDILVLQEPLRGMDLATQRKVWGALQRGNRGVIVFSASEWQAELLFDEEVIARTASNGN